MRNCAVAKFLLLNFLCTASDLQDRSGSDVNHQAVTHRNKCSKTCLALEKFLPHTAHSEEGRQGRESVKPQNRGTILGQANLFTIQRL